MRCLAMLSFTLFIFARLPLIHLPYLVHNNESSLALIWYDYAAPLNRSCPVRKRLSWTYALRGM